MVTLTTPTLTGLVVFVVVGTLVGIGVVLSCLATVLDVMCSSIISELVVMATDTLLGTVPPSMLVGVTAVLGEGVFVVGVFVEGVLGEGRDVVGATRVGVFMECVFGEGCDVVGTTRVGVFVECVLGEGRDVVGKTRVGVFVEGVPLGEGCEGVMDVPVGVREEQFSQ